MMLNSKAIGNKITTTRKKNNLSQADFPVILKTKNKAKKHWWQKTAVWAIVVGLLVETFWQCD